MNVGGDGVVRNFIETIENHDMLNQGDKVLVGLSGGADSVCLLLNFLELKNRYDLTVKAIHINHLLRGNDSDADQKFCEDLCERLNVPLTVERLDVKSYAQISKESIEEAARTLRYKAFEEHSKEFKMATAHSLPDNCETVLFNLTRGTALKGLCGIPSVRGNIIRPLINTTREEIEDYLKESNQGFVTDKTNLTTDYSRNKIRINVIPELKEINSGFMINVQKMVQSLNLENQYIEIETIKVYNVCKINAFKLDAEILKSHHKAIRHRCIALFLKENGIETSFDKIISIDDILLSNGKINLSKNVYISCKMGILSIEEFFEDIADFECEIKLGDNEFFERKVNIEVISCAQTDDFKNVNKKFANDFLDYDKIQGKVVLRNRRDGDKIQLLNRDFQSSVKKLFNAKVPLCERSHKVFISDESGIIFIEDFGVSDRVKIDENTKKVLRIAIG